MTSKRYIKIFQNIDKKRNFELLNLSKFLRFTRVLVTEAGWKVNVFGI